MDYHNWSSGIDWGYHTLERNLIMDDRRFNARCIARRKKLRARLCTHLESRPLFVESFYYDMQAENYPDSDRYYTDVTKYQEAMNEWVSDLITISRQAVDLRGTEGD